MGFVPQLILHTDVPFQSGAIMIDGGYKGTVAIEQTPTTAFSGGIELQDLPSLAKPQDADQVRQNVLTLMSARQLAGKKMTAQEIAEQLHISIEEAEIAVLSPIGDEIQIATPDLSRLSKSGSETAQLEWLLPTGTSLHPFVLVIGGGIILYFYITNQGTIVKAVSTGGTELWQKTGGPALDLARKYLPNVFAKSKSKGKDQGKDESKNQGKTIDPDKTIEEQLKGKKQLKDLRSSPKWQEKIGINDALKKKYAELKEMVKNGELTKKGLKQIEKAFEERNLGGR